MSLLANLNEMQREAVVSDAKRILVLAGAGSGKTKTLIQKVQYLICEKGIKPGNILAITFTKNAANEMLDRLIIADDLSGSYEALLSNKTISRAEKDKERVQRKKNIPWIDKLTVRTFHSLCYTILRQSSSPDVFDSSFRLLLSDLDDAEEMSPHNSIAPEKPKDILHNVLRKQCSDTCYLLRLKRYILDYLVDKPYTEKGTTTSYKNQTVYITLKGERVKSKSERDIADWLYRHGVEYQYEPQIVLKDFPFRPDFYITEANLYLEHISDRSYAMAGKEEQFRKAGLDCVKTYESEMHDSTKFNQHMDQLLRGRLNGKISRNVALNYNEEFKGYHDKVNEFLRLVERIQAEIKTEGLELSQLLQKASKSQHERIRNFYELAIPLIESYNAYCTDKSYLDFDDLIAKTITLLETRPEIRNAYAEKFRYILVDEFQDVNHQQVHLLKLLLEDHTQLFCVGDDWQSIYGFRGSEVRYIIDFKDHFEDSNVIKLNMNYRSTPSIVGASSEVIRRNKFKVDKEIEAYSQTPSIIQIYRAKRIEDDGVQHVIEKVRYLQERGYGPEDILILYRRTNMYNAYRLALKEAGLKVAAKTIHAAKGLEARAVFILGLTEGQGGFPDVWATNAIVKIVKDVKHDMLMEEERRLFYVALTRARKELYLITEMGNESIFISEIPGHFCSLSTASIGSVIKPMLLCEDCGTERKQQYNYCPTCGTRFS